MGWAPSGDLDSRKVIGQCCQSSGFPDVQGVGSLGDLDSCKESDNAVKVR